jgi:hypothetical protein
MPTVTPDLPSLLQPWTDPARWMMLRAASMYLDEQVREIAVIRPALEQQPDHDGGRRALHHREQWAREAAGRLNAFCAELLEIDRRVKEEAPEVLGEVPMPALVYGTVSTPPTEAETVTFAERMRRALGLMLARASAPEKPRADPGQPSEDRQDDIIATIRAAGVPLTREELIDKMRLPRKGGKIGHHLAWMTKNEKLQQIKGRGYWPAGTPLSV